ncbi:hypothetical protein LX32DRAFT_698540 [Colletotrichum zoysiae]|uniref:Uncharacterized protein n=1 Tax=Colletotrichum zoysiae TaxID=1216348 RepID=A0AAD9LVF7_9PEZI|nr:hypothetical protein LX32DRAFT_698540 [Colletotrichum zoysiae]
MASSVSTTELPCAYRNASSPNTIVDDTNSQALCTSKKTRENTPLCLPNAGEATPLGRPGTSDSSTQSPSSPVKSSSVESPQVALGPVPTPLSTTPTPHLKSYGMRPSQADDGLQLTRKHIFDYTKHDLSHVQSHLQVLSELEAEGAPYNKGDMWFLRRVERKLLLDRRKNAPQPAVDGRSIKAAGSGKDAVEASGAIMNKKTQKKKAKTGNAAQGKAKPQDVWDPQDTPDRFKLPIIR